MQQKALKTSASGRKCMYPHCTQTLSIYNHENYCHVHRDQLPHGRMPVVPILLDRKPTRG